MPLRFVVCVAILITTGFVPFAVAADRKIEFNRDVRPILSNNCFLCHGPDKNQLQAGLRLDKRDGAIAKLESGKTAIVPNDVSASSLVERILSTDPDMKMPPGDSGKSLSATEIETLKLWITQGAEYQGHWSFIPPVRRDPPQVSKFSNQIRNEIDNFILNRLVTEGLEPSSEADKVSLIRRATFDLTGLPPTPAEVDAYLADPSTEAYERVVDRLLMSPRYGEHQGRIWLDAARYGDTHGLHLDNERSLWPYREYVIKAFNQNLPFDQFTIEQLAGDLLPNATIEQKVASGFNRCNVSTSEGGSIDDEVYVRYAVDRTEALSTVFLGLTLQCAVCHSHKFDPISQKEFYSLYSYFYSMADKAMDGNALLPPPILKLPTEEQSKRQSDLEAQLAAAQQDVATTLAKLKYVDPYEDSDPPVDALSVTPRQIVWFDDDVLPNGARPQGNTPWTFVTKSEGPVYSGEKSSTRTAAGLSQHFFEGAEPGLNIGDGDTLFAYVYLDPANPPKAIMLQFNDGSWEHRRNWGDEDAIGFGAKNTPAKRLAGPLPKLGEWVRLEVSAADVGLAPGSKLNGWAFTQFDGTCYWDKAGIEARSSIDTTAFDSQVAWEQSEQPTPSKTLPGPIKDLLKVERSKRSDDQRKQLRDYFLKQINVATRTLFMPLDAKVADIERQKKDLDASISATMISEDLPQPREAFVLVRGAYDKKSDKVDRGVPAVLPPLPDGVPNNRLGLAKWLVSPDHPLMSRVIVNRYWQQFFGTGIVKTAEDFGAQGTWPTHPELLDWLANEFIRTGWDVKRMHKLMLMSGTYRQSTHVSPVLLARDPENLLLARGPRFRFDAEVIRDSVLFVSGLLVERTGGKSVKPYQPEGIWEAVAFVGSNTREFKQDSGESLYRRSLYTFWKRTAPPPSMSTFDAPSRENCTVRRPRTNTPLQALALMNDKQYIDAARKLAERMIAEGGSTADSRLIYGFRLVTARQPTDREMEVLRRTFDKESSSFQADREAAEKLVAYGELPKNTQLDPVEYATWTMIANLLINLDETITK